MVETRPATSRPSPSAAASGKARSSRCSLSRSRASRGQTPSPPPPLLLLLLTSRSHDYFSSPLPFSSIYQSICLSFSLPGPATGSGSGSSCRGTAPRRSSWSTGSPPGAWSGARLGSSKNSPPSTRSSSEAGSSSRTPSSSRTSHQATPIPWPPAWASTTSLGAWPVARPPNPTLLPPLEIRFLPASSPTLAVRSVLLVGPKVAPAIAHIRETIMKRKVAPVHYYYNGSFFVNILPVSLSIFPSVSSL